MCLESHLNYVIMLPVTRQFISLCPAFNIAYEPPGNSSLDAILNEEGRVLILIYLFQVQSILQRDIASSTKLFLQYVVINFRLLPLAIQSNVNTSLST